MKAPNRFVEVWFPLLGASALLVCGCFNPHIKPGAFQCSKEGNLCPAPLFCDRSLGLCVDRIHDAGSAIDSGQRADGGVGDAAADGPVDASPEVSCLPPVVTCTPSPAGTGLCDPVCNTGCACNEKCSVNSAGALTCNPPAPKPPNESPETCSVTLPAGDVSHQTDDCPAGTICTNLTTCGWICRQFCRSNSDCASQNCGRDVGGGLKVCDVPILDCDPVPGATSCGSAANRACYLSSATLKTVCDCPNTTGVGNGPCTDSRDCYPGQVCYNPSGMAGQSRCLRVCRLPAVDGSDTTRVDAGESSCNGGPGACRPIGTPTIVASTPFGYCPE
jgi:hypothetical protein